LFAKLDFKYLIFIFLLSLLIYPITLKITFSFDAGLYHLPYQNVLRTEKISIGLANMSRFGFSTLQDYINSILWTGNFILNKYLIGFYLIIFFSFLFDLNKNSSILNKIILFSILVSLPFASRYFVLATLKTDLALLVFLIIFYYFCLKYFLLENYDEKKKYFQLVSLLLLLVIMSKSTGLISIIIFLVIVFNHLKSNFKLKELILSNYLIILILALWILKNFVISGCLIYPIEFSCFNFIEWNASHQAMIDQGSVTMWNRQPFAGDEPLKNSKWFFEYWIKTYDKFILSGIFILFLIFTQNYLLSKNKNKLLPYILTLIISLIFFQEETAAMLLPLISKKNILSIVILFSLFVLIIIFKSRKEILVSLKINKWFIISFGLYSLISIFIWFIKAPNPRFGIGYFVSFFIFFSVFCFLIFNKKQKLDEPFNYFKRINLVYILFYLIFLSSQSTSSSNYYSLFKIHNQSFWFKKNNSKIFEDFIFPEVKLIKREKYGYFSESSQCWLDRNCYNSTDVVLYDKILGYKYYKMYKN
jgi:hypothetical protein